MHSVISAHLLIVSAIFLFLFMSGWFLIAKSRRRLDSVDIAWGLGFVLIAWVTELQKPSSRSLLVATLIAIWGIRLSKHIYKRSKFRGEDRRYKELSSKWKRFFWLRAYISIFIFQGLLLFLISAPVFVAPNAKLSGHWSLLSYYGALLWAIGFIIEAVSDKQLSNYLKMKDRPKVLQTGLWQNSRHPNYFGELVQWWAIGIIVLQVSYGWVGLIGPLILSILIVFVSGIPPIERHRSKDKEYFEYQKRTSVLLPLPRR